MLGIAGFHSAVAKANRGSCAGNAKSAPGKENVAVRFSVNAVLSPSKTSGKEPVTDSGFLQQLPHETKFVEELMVANGDPPHCGMRHQVRNRMKG